MEILTPLLALFLGLTTAASFCAIHVLSSVAVYSVSAGKFNKLRPFLIALGNFLAILLIGFTMLGVGFAIKEYIIYLQIPAAIFVLGIGIYLIFSKDKSSCGRSCGCKVDSVIDKLKSKGLFGSFLFGFSIGLLCVSCMLPIFGTIIAMTALTEYTIILLLISYAIGHTLPILAVAYIPYFSDKFAKGKLKKQIVNIRKIAGITLLIVGTYLFWQIFSCDYDCQKHHHNHHNHHNHEIQEHHHATP